MSSFHRWEIAPRITLARTRTSRISSDSSTSISTGNTVGAYRHMQRGRQAWYSRWPRARVESTTFMNATTDQASNSAQTMRHTSNMIQHDICDSSQRQKSARAHATRKISSSSNGGDESNVLRSSSLQHNDVHIRTFHCHNVHFVVLTSSSVKVDLSFGATLVLVAKCSDSAQNERVDAH
jgi:hypothetical protein